MVLEVTLPAPSYARTTILFVPRAKISDDAVHVAVFQVPTLAATPLPPRSLTQVTLLILRSSDAEPPRDTVEEVVA
jgi:hypothetical protein